MALQVAVIADIVGSRQLTDRSAAQQSIESCAAQVHRDHPVDVAPLEATVGDEFQGIYPDLTAALTSLLLMQLALPEGIELRFGIGVGLVDDVGSSGKGIMDGPGWWAAREAIDHVHRLQDRVVPSARTRVAHSAEQDADMSERIAYANAYLLVRDETVGSMSERSRRLTYGRCLGRTQRELAEREGITQPAVSQALATAGAAAIVSGFESLSSSR